MSQVEYTLLNKKLAFSFSVGQKFAVKVANNIVGEFIISRLNGRLYAVGKFMGYSFCERTSPYFLDDESFYGKAVYQVIETENFNPEVEYPNHRKALVGKQFVTGRRGEVYIACRKVRKTAQDPVGAWGANYKAADDISFVLRCETDGQFTVQDLERNSNYYFQVNSNMRNTAFLVDYFLYRLIPNEVQPTAQYGVIKTPTDDRSMYIIWTPSSIAPPQQIFTSAKQARYVAYRMSEQHKGCIFHWAKLEGHAQWGELPTE